MFITQIVWGIFFISPLSLQKIISQKANVEVTRLRVFLGGITLTVIFYILFMISACIADYLLAGQKIASL